MPMPDRDLPGTVVGTAWTRWLVGAAEAPWQRRAETGLVDEPMPGLASRSPGPLGRNQFAQGVVHVERYQTKAET